MSESYWQELEAGTRPIPDAVTDCIVQIAKWRQRTISTLRNRLKSLPKAGITTLVWYDSVEDRTSLPDRLPLYWRPHQSVCAMLLSQYPDQILLIPFDSRSYTAWLADRQDSEQMRAIWSATLNIEPGR